MRKLVIPMIIASFLTACVTNGSVSMETNNTDSVEVNEDLSNIESEIELTLEDEATDGEYHSASVEISDNIKGFKEYVTIDEEVELNNHYIEIVEDNFGKRIMLIKDDNKQEVYKTIFTKKTNRLKIIEIDKGQIYNQIISS